MAIARKDKLTAGYNGPLESVVVHDAEGKATAHTNGLFVTLGGLVAGEREVKKATLATSADVAESVLYVHAPEVMYDERQYKVADYVTEAGKAVTAYHLFEGDIVTLSEDLFATAVKVDDVLVVEADGKLGVNAEAVATAKVVFDVIEDCTGELAVGEKAFAVQVRFQ